MGELRQVDRGWIGYAGWRDRRRLSADDDPAAVRAAEREHARHDGWNTAATASPAERGAGGRADAVGHPPRAPSAAARTRLRGSAGTPTRGGPR
ncbi:hypothetical protein AB0C02_31290 [Micromonospora sp. NPDC048999]|uniref:hypothetical protein n=1 Tax=Micromonospora sp. NPDC048999 TaxID=3155391 RepID=UPI003408A169